MMGKTHNVIAITTASILNVMDLSFKSIIYAIVIYISSIMPDIDIKIGIKHRQFTHSLLCLAILSLSTWLIYKPLGVLVLIGYGTHILADSFTRMGVAAFYPCKRMVGLKRIATGSAVDWFIFYVCLGYIYLKYIK